MACAAPICAATSTSSCSAGTAAATPQRLSTPCSASARASDPPTTATSSDNAADPGRPGASHRPPFDPLQSGPNTGPPACLTALETNFPKSKSSRTSPGTVQEPCRERRMPETTSGVTGCKGISLKNISMPRTARWRGASSIGVCASSGSAGTPACRPVSKFARFLAADLGEVCLHAVPEGECRDRVRRHFAARPGEGRSTVLIPAIHDLTTAGLPSWDRMPGPGGPGEARSAHLFAGTRVQC